MQAGSGNDDSEPFYMRMTPMEADVQLQVAELIFRSVLEGKRPPISDHEDIDSWEKDVLGAEWSAKNDQQRREILRQVKLNGENSPAWMECLAHMGDISWEIFEAGQKGERMRKLASIDRMEIIEQFTDLKAKVELSYYGKCGAGDRLFGLRACVAMFRTFIRDPEVLELMANTVAAIIDDHEYNRESLTCLTVPPPPQERSEDDKDRGWSFLRNALNAFVVQAGGIGYDENENDKHPPESTSNQAALAIAKCIVLTKNTPAVLVQLVIAFEEDPANAWPERKQLRDIIPRAYQKCQAMSEVMPEERAVWDELRGMLARRELAKGASGGLTEDQLKAATVSESAGNMIGQFFGHLTGGT